MEHPRTNAAAAPAALLAVLLAISLVPGSFSCSPSSCSFTLSGGTSQAVDVFLLGSRGGTRNLIRSQSINYIDGLGPEETIRFGKSNIYPSLAGQQYQVWIFVYPEGGAKTSPAGYTFKSSESATYSS